MTQKFEVRTEAERFIHNDLSACAFELQNQMRQKLDSGETDGIYYLMMSALIFTAFSVEAKVNFVGWKKLQEGWPEKASLHEKIDLLKKILSIDFKWGERPLQTIKKLYGLRNTLAHGKPEIVDQTEEAEVEPVVWDALRSQWERTVSPEFVDRCLEDEDVVWKRLLESAGIPAHETLTHGGHQLRQIVEPVAER